MQRLSDSSPKKYLTKLHKKTTQSEHINTGQIFQNSFNLLEKALDQEQKTLDLGRVFLARDPQTSTLDYLAICTRILSHTDLKFLFLDETHISLISAQKLVIALDQSSIVLVSMGGCVFAENAAEVLAEWYDKVQQKVSLDVMTLVFFKDLAKNKKMAVLEKKIVENEKALEQFSEQKNLPAIPNSKKLMQQPATVFGPTIQKKITEQEKNVPLSPAYRFRRRRGA